MAITQAYGDFCGNCGGLMQVLRSQTGRELRVCPRCAGDVAAMPAALTGVEQQSDQDSLFDLHTLDLPDGGMLVVRLPVGIAPRDLEDIGRRLGEALAALGKPGYPIALSANDVSFDDTVLARALDAFNRAEHRGRCEAMREALLAAFGEG